MNTSKKHKKKGNQTLVKSYFVHKLKIKFLKININNF